MSGALRDLAVWLDAKPDPFDGHRLTINRSITPGYWFVRLEVGPFGSGACVWYGKARTIPEAIQGALDAAKVHPNG